MLKDQIFESSCSFSQLHGVMCAEGKKRHHILLCIPKNNFDLASDALILLFHNSPISKEIQNFVFGENVLSVSLYFVASLRLFRRSFAISKSLSKTCDLNKLIIFYSALQIRIPQTIFSTSGFSLQKERGKIK